MINTESLRSKILSFAMRGELSKREDNDGNAKDLYSHILMEKTRLVKKGELRKDKKYNDIKPEELPFTIPDNWHWARFGKIINLQSGQDLNSSDYNSDEKGIPYITGASNYTDDGRIIINRWTENPKAFAKKNDILLSCKGTVGKLAILKEDKVHIARQIMGIRTFCIDVSFAYYYVQSMLYGIKEAQKGLIPGIERNDVLDLICPLPPVAEQTRIVDAIASIFSLLDIIDDLQTRYDADRDVLKGKLIDAAICGKLTKQLPEDGTAEELLKIIRKEKDALIKIGDIPKEKTSAKISDEEKWQTLPNNWSYARVQDVAIYITDYVANGSFATLKANTTTYKEPNYAVFVRTLDLGANFKNDLSYIDKLSYDFLKKSKLYGGELILPNIGASIGKAFIMPDLGMPMSLAPNSIMIKFQSELMNKYFYYFFQSSRGQGVLTHIQGGAATAKFSKTDLRKMVLLLPPLSEQQRIVETLDNLLANLAQ